MFVFIIHSFQIVIYLYIPYYFISIYILLLHIYSTFMMNQVDAMIQLSSIEPLLAPWCVAVALNPAHPPRW